MKSKSLVIALFTFLSLTISFAQTFDTSDFVLTTPPKGADSEWLNLNYSKNSFNLSIVNHQLQIDEAGRQAHAVLDFENGKLVGFDHGEFGGELIYSSTDTTVEDIHIKDGNIKFIFCFNDEIYFIEGLAHMSISEGAMYRLKKSSSGFTFKKVLNFDDAPAVFAIYGGVIYIGSAAGFYTINKDLKATKIFNDTFWSGLYPNSVAVLNQKLVYLGIRGGFLELNLETKEFLFYKFKG